jgi:hypothetical protein
MLCSINLYFMWSPSAHRPARKIVQFALYLKQQFLSSDTMLWRCSECLCCFRSWRMNDEHINESKIEVCETPLPGDTLQLSFWERTLKSLCSIQHLTYDERDTKSNVMKQIVIFKWENIWNVFHVNCLWAIPAMFLSPKWAICNIYYTLSKWVYWDIYVKR